MQIIQSIRSRIYTIRGERVMLDYDLAELYEVATKAPYQAGKKIKEPLHIISLIFLWKF